MWLTSLYILSYPAHLSLTSLLSRGTLESGRQERIWNDNNQQPCAAALGNAHRDEVPYGFWIRPSRTTARLRYTRFHRQMRQVSTVYLSDGHWWAAGVWWLMQWCWCGPVSCSLCWTCRGIWFGSVSREWGEWEWVSGGENQPLSLDSFGHNLGHSFEAKFFFLSTAPPYFHSVRLQERLWTSL